MQGTDFLASLSTATVNMYNTRKELLLLGDFNMEMYENRDESRFPDTRLVDFCNRFCLSNRIDNATRVTKTSKSVIDVLLTSHVEGYASIKAIRNLRFSSEFNYSLVSTSYIRNILDHLNPRKAVGVDGISPRILRLGSPVLAEEVTKLINFFIVNRSLPSEWKQAHLAPVFKRRIDTDKANYRPVSILTLK